MVQQNFFVGVKKNLPLNDLWDQGYDNGSNMRGNDLQNKNSI